MTEAEYQYQERMAKLYQEQVKTDGCPKYLKMREEQEELLQRYFPIDPFDGAWIGADRIGGIEFLALALVCQDEIFRSRSSAYKGGDAVHIETNNCHSPLIRVNEDWLYERRKQITKIGYFADALLKGEEAKTDSLRKDADPQLLSYFEEVKEEIDRIRASQLQNAAVDFSDDGVQWPYGEGGRGSDERF